MKFYDKCGNSHKSMIGAMTANMFGSPDINHQTTGYKPEQVVATDNKLSDEEVSTIVETMVGGMDGMVDTYVSGGLNCEAAERRFFEVFIGIIRNSIMDNPEEFINNSEAILTQFGDRVTSMIAVKRKIRSIEQEPKTL